MKENENSIKTTPLLLEVVNHGEGKVTFIVRTPQSGQILCMADSSAELCEFLDSFIG